MDLAFEHSHYDDEETLPSLVSPSQAGIVDLPYLPGIRKYGSGSPLSRKNWSRSSVRGSQRSLASSPPVSVSYEDLDAFQSMLSPFPHNAESFNETSGRYSIRAQTADREARNLSLQPPSADGGFTSPIRSVEESSPLSEITVLRFAGYFREAIPNSRIEHTRIRKCFINYHLQDGSIDIVEPRTPNSGLLQGKYLRRHRVPNVRRPTSSEGFSGTRGHEEFITLKDLRVGADVYVYTQKITIVDCDERTRQYLRSIGEPAAEPIPIPLDDYAQFQLSMPKRQQRSRKSGGANKFFKFGSAVLRFFATSEETGQEIDGPSKFCIDYYLRDDTFEITQMGNARKRAVAVLNRLRVPKQGHAAVTAMQVYAEDEHLYFHWTDFSVGAKLDILGHQYTIVDADPFTRKFYESHGMPQMEALPDVPAWSARSKLGTSREDAEANGEQFFADAMSGHRKKAHHLAGVILKFGAKLARPSPGSSSRTFNIQVFLEDDTVQIRELPVRNSGFTGGKFLARGRHKNGNKPLVPTDLYIGARITVAATDFVVTGADSFTLDYMENRAHEWVHSDIHHITDKLLGHKATVQTVLMNDVHSPDGAVSFKEFKTLMTKHVGILWSQQETVTLARAVCPDSNESIDTHAVLKLLEDIQQS